MYLHLIIKNKNKKQYKERKERKGRKPYGVMIPNKQQDTSKWTTQLDMII